MFLAPTFRYQGGPRYLKNGVRVGAPRQCHETFNLRQPSIAKYPANIVCRPRVVL